MSLPLMAFLLPESMHWLAVNGRQDECKELLKDLAEVNGTELLAGGAVSVDKFNPVDKGEEDSQLPMNWRFLQIFGSELLGTTAYLVIAFTACGYIYYGHIFIYPRLLEVLYGLEMKEAYTAVMFNSCVEILVIVAMMFYMDMQYIGRRGAMATGFFVVVVASLFAMMEEQNEIY